MQREADDEIKRLREHVGLLEEYRRLGEEELSELAPLAWNRGWRSSRVSEGERLRAEIAALHTDTEGGGDG